MKMDLRNSVQVWTGTKLGQDRTIWWAFVMNLQLL